MIIVTFPFINKQFLWSLAKPKLDNLAEYIFFHRTDLPFRVSIMEIYEIYIMLGSLRKILLKCRFAICF